MGLALEFPLMGEGAPDKDGYGAGFSREDVKRVERELVVAGVDAYRYEPGETDHPLEVIEHLTRAGVTVLVVTDEHWSEELASGAGNLVLRGWQPGVGTDPEGVVRYVRELAAARVGNVEDGGYI